MSQPIRLKATFRPQAPWENDFTYYLEGQEVEFDATEALLILDLEKIKSFQHNNYDSDNLVHYAAIPAYLDHGGPYEVDTDIDEWLEQNGVPDRKEMSQADLDRLRKAFGIKPKEKHDGEANPN